MKVSPLVHMSTILRLQEQKGTVSVDPRTGICIEVSSVTQRISGHIKRWRPQKEIKHPDPGLSNLPPCALLWSQKEKIVYLTPGLGSSDPHGSDHGSDENGLITDSHKGWYPGKPGRQGSSFWPSRSPHWVLQMWEGRREGRDNTPSRKRLSWGLPSRESSKRSRITPTVPYIPCSHMVLGVTDIVTVFLHHRCKAA